MDFLIGRHYGGGMSAHTLKIVAAVAMVVDHVAWAFVPTESALGQVMHFIGRLTAPIMMYFVVEGYHHTKNLRNYALRLGVFALISHLPYRFFVDGQWPLSAGRIQLNPTSFIYSLFVGLISLMVWNSDRLSFVVKGFLIFGLCVAAKPGDGSYFAVLMILAFGAYRGDFRWQARSYVAIVLATLVLSGGIFVWYRFGMFLAVPLLRQYNGTLGGSKNSKWFFYVFYPLHLLILGLLRHSV